MEILDRDKIPTHIAIIMDGNGRWAKRKGFPRILGHRRGAKKAKEIVTICRKIGIRFLTLYVFSSENWHRPAHEVNMLMKLLEDFLQKEEKDLRKNNIKLVASGNIDRLPSKTKRVLEKVIKGTDTDSFKMLLNFALSYGGREEIVEATKKIVSEVLTGKYHLKEIDEKIFSAHLYNAYFPDPDLLIRTGGEMRISNFLLWQIAYTEIYVTSVLWPDFSKDDLMEAIIDYQKRERKFGRI